MKSSFPPFRLYKCLGGGVLLATQVKLFGELLNLRSKLWHSGVQHSHEWVRRNSEVYRLFSLSLRRKGSLPFVLLHRLRWFWPLSNCWTYFGSHQLRRPPSPSQHYSGHSINYTHSLQLFCLYTPSVLETFLWPTSVSCPFAAAPAIEWLVVVAVRVINTHPEQAQSWPLITATLEVSAQASIECRGSNIMRPATWLEG